MPDNGLPPCVLHIAGVGRSGSTLVERLVLPIIGGTGLGETAYLVQRGLQGRELCACGHPVDGCELWSAALSGPRDEVNYAELERYEGRRRSLRGLAKRVLPSEAQGEKKYLSFLDQVFTSMAASGVVVDTSKGFPHLLTLNDIFKKRRLFIVHLVRDPRAVVFSWTRRRYRPEAGDYMEPRGAVGVAIHWLVHNLLISLLGPRMSSGYVRIRYEDVCHDPATVQRALKSLGMTGRGAEPSYHSIAGNPMRFTQPQIEIRLDEEWRTVMSDSSRRLAWWLTAPLSRKFGYRRES